MAKSDIIVLMTSASINLLIGFIVLIRNYKKATNIIFFATSFSVVVWAVFNSLSQNLSDNNLILTRVTGFSASVAISQFYLLSTVFPSPTKHNKRLTYGLAITSVIIYILCFTNLFVASATKAPSEGLDVKSGPLYFLFPTYLLLIVSLCIRNLLRQYKTASRLSRSQLSLLWSGILITAGLTIVTNVILPAVTKDWSFGRYGTLFTVPFVAITAYAVLKRHMFDVRTVVARIVAYIVTLGIIVSIYSLILVVIVARLISFNSISIEQLIALSIPTIVSALTFQRIKTTVDYFTLRIFYKGAYQTRDVLDKLSDVLISENDLDQLIKKGLGTLVNALLPSSAYLVVFDEDGSMHPYKELCIGSCSDKVDIRPYAKILTDHEKPLYIIDAQPGRTMEKLMSQNNHSIVLRLGDKEHPLGLICFGTKKSGSIYTSQDTKMLTIAAKNIALALENARRYEKIKHFAETLKHEVNHATERLRHANEKLRTLDKLKDDFLSMASHQFRTPAGSIRQAFKMIRDPNLSKKDREEVLRLAEANSEQLSSLVNTMLDISRIEAGRFTIDRTLTDIPNLVDKIILASDIVAEQKHIKLDFERPDHTILLEADRAKISEAMKNYVENAIKYSPEGSTVHIKLFQDETVVHFEVQDTGMGVPEEERHSLFNKFYRAQNARTFQPDGNGIGLYVVKNIVEGHGGTAYYKPLDQGSLFGFSLPLHEHHKHPDE